MTLNTAQYLDQINKAFDKETTNADFWLQAKTKPLMMKIVIDELVTKMAAI